MPQLDGLWRPEWAGGLLTAAAVIHDLWAEGLEQPIRDEKTRRA